MSLFLAVIAWPDRMTRKMRCASRKSFVGQEYPFIFRIRFSNLWVLDNAKKFAKRFSPLSQAWITDELLEHTRHVWSQAYARVISEAEAIELLTNVKRFAEVLLKIKRRRNTE
jgi:hypothetical protein